MPRAGLPGVSLLRSSGTASPLGLWRNQRRQTFDRKRVAGDSEAAKTCPCDRGDMRVMTKVFACKDVADVHLDNWQADGGDGVADSERGVGVGAGVYHDAGGVVSGGFLDRIDNFAFVIGLT